MVSISGKPRFYTDGRQLSQKGMGTMQWKVLKDPESLLAIASKGFSVSISIPL